MTLFFILVQHLCISLVLTSITWLIFLKVKNMSIIDITWGLGFFILISYDYFVLAPMFINNSYDLSFHFPILIFLVLIWSARLSLFLFITRIRNRHLDARYESIKASWKSKSSVNVLFNYWFQGVLQAILSLAFIPILFSSSTNLPLLPIFICFIGIIGEALADYQLLIFKQQDSSELICQNGLWRFSRHPNYFFDILFWAGIAYYTYLATQNIIVFVSPVLLYVIMRFVTGRISERLSLQKKGDSYKSYQKNTFMIFPKLFNRKH
tara:strand:- start:3734 stop:4531 length:798 start_codon:yes stop_codon:yes gene_type:complete